MNLTAKFEGCRQEQPELARFSCSKAYAYAHTSDMSCQLQFENAKNIFEPFSNKFSLNLLPSRSFTFNTSDGEQFMKKESYSYPTMVTIKRFSQFGTKKQLKATDTLQLLPATVPLDSPTVHLHLPESSQQETFAIQHQSSTLSTETVDYVEPIPMEEEYLDDSYEEQKPVILETTRKTETPIVKKKRKAIKKEFPSEPKRSLIQVQTTTVEDGFSNAPQSFPQVTNVSTLVEPSSNQMLPPTLPIQNVKTEIEDCDDGMDMFFQSVKRTIRLTNLSPMEKLDLQMSILQVIREKVFLKDGTQ